MKNTKILIIGSTGFIGNHLYSHFSKQGAQVFGVGRKKSSQLNYTQLDLQDNRHVDRLFQSTNPDVCIYAAGSAVAKSIKNTSDYFYDQKCLINTLDACSKQKTRRTIFVSSSYALVDCNKSGFAYASLKQRLEQIFLNFINLHSFQATIMRFVNIYGPGDKHLSRIIPKIIHSALAKEEVKLWGNGMQVRQYLYIDDAIKAFDKVFQMNDDLIKKYPILNFGPSSSISVTNLARLIIHEMKLDTPIVFEMKNIRKDVDSILIESSVANNFLQWSPKTSIRAGISQTINWMKKKQL